jgi:hypothetical protein
MSDTSKLEAQLALSKLCDDLEAAREVMHADRSDAEALELYNDLSEQVAKARSDFRTEFPVEVPDYEDADGTAVPEPIEVAGEVKPQ